MIKTVLASGVYPTMLTPYNEDGSVDYSAIAAMTEWYIAEGSAGIFANCLSSEINQLDLDERDRILGVVMETINGRVPVVASGMTASDPDKQIDELKRMASHGISAVVLIVSRMIAENESEDVLKERTKAVMEALPDCDFGLYECPFPYQRHLSPEFLNWCAETDRFVFFKDTSCRIADIKVKLDAIRGSRLQMYNANSATLLESLQHGASGLSGVMANIHPRWYSMLIKAYFDGDIAYAQKIQNIVGAMSIFQYQKYQLNAKYYAGLIGLPIKTVQCRNFPGVVLSESNEREIEQFYELSKYIETLI